MMAIEPSCIRNLEKKENIGFKKGEENKRGKEAEKMFFGDVKMNDDHTRRPRRFFAICKPSPGSFHHPL